MTTNDTGPAPEPDYTGMTGSERRAARRAHHRALNQGSPLAEDSGEADQGETKDGTENVSETSEEMITSTEVDTSVSTGETETSETDAETDEPTNLGEAETSPANVEAVESDVQPIAEVEPDQISPQASEAMGLSSSSEDATASSQLVVNDETDSPVTAAQRVHQEKMAALTAARANLERLETEAKEAEATTTKARIEVVIATMTDLDFSKAAIERVIAAIAQPEPRPQLRAVARRTG